MAKPRSSGGGDGSQLLIVAAGSLVAGAALFWATKQAIDYYIPYKYHYRPGTFSGWLAGVLNKYSKHRRGARPVRVYMDGCFDMMHYGHANALRQAKALGDELVVGLIPDSEILKVKGPPVQNDEERYTMVEQVKWVDDVVTGVPYDLSPEFIDELFSKHKVDYIIHGDDPCLLPDGTDAYAHAKKLGRFKMIKRTEGVSTTDIVGRMLMCTRPASFRDREHEAKGHPLTQAFTEPPALSENGEDTGDEQQQPQEEQSPQKEQQQQPTPPPPQQQQPKEPPQEAPSGSSPRALGLPPTGRTPQRSLSRGPSRVSRFMPTSRRLVQFSEGKTAPVGGRVVYIDGAFDVFHPGHVEILKLAKAQGDFLLVGLHSDEDVARRRGPHLPIMSVHERALSVLACRYVDEVVIGAPEQIDANLLSTFNIGLVVRGSRSETSHQGPTANHRYALPQSRGIFRELPSPSAATTRNVINRIVANREAYEARNAKKAASEARYYEAKDAAVGKGTGFVQEV